MEYKIGLVDPSTNRLMSIVRDLGIFDFNNYPTAYMKVDINSMFPEPTLGQIWRNDLQTFLDELPVDEESLPSLTKMKAIVIKKVYAYAKSEIEAVGSAYSIYETNEWPRLLEEARRFVADSSDIGPVLKAKKNKGGVSLSTYVPRVITKSDDLHAFLGAVTIWRNEKVDEINGINRRATLNTYDYKSGFPTI